MTEVEKRKYKRMAWIGLTLGAILLLIGLNIGSKVLGTNLLLVYLVDATIISGLLAILFGALGVVAYATLGLKRGGSFVNKRIFIVFTLIIFCLSFAISTVAYRETYPEFIRHVKVVRYGFPLAWLKERTVFLPIPPQYSPTHYEVLWLELIVDFVFYMVLAAGISFAVTKFTGIYAGLRKYTCWRLSG